MCGCINLYLQMNSQFLAICINLYICVHICRGAHIYINVYMYTYICEYVNIYLYLHIFSKELAILNKNIELGLRQQFSKHSS